MAFIKIDRDILNSYCFSNPNHLKIWIWILLKANFKKNYVSVNTGKGTTTIEVNRGQFIFGRLKAEEELDIHNSLIYRAMKKFEELGQIKVESNNQYSLVTICKYDSYQSKNDKSEQPMNNQRTTNAQPTNNQRTTNEQRMNNQRTTNEQRMNTTKEGKEGKEGKEVFLGKIENLPNEITSSIKTKLNITKGIILKDGDVQNLWDCFKSENKDVKKYENENEAYKHFSNWINLQDFKKSNLIKGGQIEKITGIKFSDDKTEVYFSDGTSQKLGESQLSLINANMTNPSQIVKGLIY
jgi:hypothetical protein